VAEGMLQLVNAQSSWSWGIYEWYHRLVLRRQEVRGTSSVYSNRENSFICARL